jgi:hypothetical protein
MVGQHPELYAFPELNQFRDEQTSGLLARETSDPVPHREAPMNRLRLLVSILALVALASTLVACGGDSGGGGGGEDPQKVLDQTFSSHPSIKSGNLDLKLKIDVKQHGNEGGSVNAGLTGPFENQGAGKIPKFDFAVTGSYDNFDPAGPESDFDFEGGLTSTSDATFFSFNYKGTKLFPGNFRIDRSQFALFKGALLAIPESGSLLTNLSNEGSTAVDGTSTTHISGDLDLDKAPGVLRFVLSNSRALTFLGLGNLGGSKLPPDSQAVNSQIVAAADRLINAAHVDIYSGKQDNVLRRLAIHLSLSGVSVETVDVSLDIQLSDLNKPQTIEAPPNPKPFSDLIREFKAYGAAVS